MGFWGLWVVRCWGTLLEIAWKKMAGRRSITVVGMGMGMDIGMGDVVIVIIITMGIMVMVIVMVIAIIGVGRDTILVRVIVGVLDGLVC